MVTRLGLEWHELRPAYDLRRLANSLPPRTIDERKQQLIGLLLAANFPIPAGSHPTKAAVKALAEVTYLKIVQQAGDVAPTLDAQLVEATWRMCSGVAHGDTNAIIGLLATTVRQAEPGMQLMQIAAPVRLLYGAAIVAMSLTSHGFVLLKQLTQPAFPPTPAPPPLWQVLME